MSKKKSKGHSSSARRPEKLIEAVEKAAKKIGRNPGKIVDHILRAIAPRSVIVTKHEDIFPLFRDGVVAEIRAMLKAGDADAAQRDFKEISPEFREYVAELSNTSYYVPSRDEFVSVGRLTRNAAELTEARDYIIQKGDECYAEGKLLSALLRAVLRKERRETKEKV